MNETRPYRISQDEMKYIFEAAKHRMDSHPDAAKKDRETIDKHTLFKSEKEALTEVFKRANRYCFKYQIWAKVEKGIDGIYRVQNQWLVSNDNHVILAAEYIGMAQMYDGTRIERIINSGVEIDDVIAYWE